MRIIASGGYYVVEEGEYISIISFFDEGAPDSGGDLRFLPGPALLLIQNFFNRRYIRDPLGSNFLCFLLLIQTVPHQYLLSNSKSIN